jgi:transposase InsO family protein
MQVPYYEIIKDSSNPYGWRIKMVEYAIKHGIKPAARDIKLNPKTVRKWVERFKISGNKGLTCQKRGPKIHANKTSSKIENDVIALRLKRKNNIGPLSIKNELELAQSTSTIFRMLKDNPKTNIKRKRKHQKKRDLREIKAKLKPFEKIQIDVKYLNDIPQYYTYLRKLKFPKFELTARDVKTGAVFVSYAYENTNINAASFVTYLLEHLIKHGITVKDICIQTDNGSEFIGNWTPKSSSLFSYMIQEVYGSTHLRIPPGRPNYNAEVETFHRLVEEHFYDLEDYTDISNFLDKAYSYILHFNYSRKNSYKWNKTPVKILNEANVDIDPAVLSLPPIIVDYHSMLYLKKLNPSEYLFAVHEMPDSPGL